MNQLLPRTNNSIDQKGVDNTSEINKQYGYDINSYELMKLREKHGKDGDKHIDRVLEEFKEKNNKIKKVANLFVEKFVSKFGLSMPLHSILEKAQKYKKKYNLSDDEFAQVKRSFEEKLFKSMGSLEKRVQHNTNLARALGNAFVETFDGVVVSNTDDYQYLQEIIKTYTINRQVYQNIVFQTSTYQNLDERLLDESKYDPKIPIYNYAHPVLVAFFLPKIQSIEERMLYANLAGIIVARFNKTSISTKPDHELLYALVNDPNDIVCSNATPIIDLYHRCLVQLQLWRSVYELRSGKCYSPAHVDFLSAVDNCKINNNDNPDMVILSDEGIILRRLFSAFSLRPIHIMSSPIAINLLQNPYGYVPDQRVINSLPYITYRLPTVNEKDKIYNLTDSNTQFTFSLDVNTGRFVPNTSRIFEVNGPLVYYIPRKYIDIPIPLGAISNISQLPTVINNKFSFQKISVSFDKQIVINENIYNLLSVVSISFVSTTGLTNNTLIDGNMTTLFSYSDPNINLSCTVYSPQHVIKNNNKPYITLTGPNIEEKTNELKTSGCIFVYNKAKLII
jgi:hypothetical protein